MLAVSTFILSCLHLARAQLTEASTSPQELAANYNLTTTIALDFPPLPITNGSAAGFILASSTWNVPSILYNAGDLSFVADPFPSASPNTQNSAASPSNSSATVLAVNYPQGSYSHNTGGIQFNNFFGGVNDETDYQSMMVTYEVAFDSGFNFVKGGKLPGLRGGPQTNGCSGGAQPNGTDCFSVRLMWRTLGTGEAYAYIPTPNNLCKQTDVICNDDGYGVSFDRGTFSFTPAQWTRVTMLIRLNDPTYANGELWVYYNDLLAIKVQDLYYRSSMSIGSVQGMYFSTFFGGSDTTWSTPISQNTYFRNIQLWAGTSESNVTGQPVKSLNGALGHNSQGTAWLILGTFAFALAMNLL